MRLSRGREEVAPQNKEEEEERVWFGTSGWVVVFCSCSDSVLFVCLPCTVLESLERRTNYENRSDIVRHAGNPVDFSANQMKAYLKKSKINQKIKSARAAMNPSNTGTKHSFPKEQQSVREKTHLFCLLVNTCNLLFVCWTLHFVSKSFDWLLSFVLVVCCLLFVTLL